MIYAGDFAQVVMMAMDVGEKIGYDVFNLGSGITTTVGEVVDCALRHAGHTPDAIQYHANQPSTVSFRALDCAKIQRVLGWSPVFSIDEGIGRTVAWWRENRHWWNK